MNKAVDQSEQQSPARVGVRVCVRSSGNRSGFVIAAIGFQLLLCSLASAADACSGTLDRIETTVAHAIREMVDRQVLCESSLKPDQTGYRLNDCAHDTIIAPDHLARTIEQQVHCWLLNLPPPAESTAL